MIVDPSENGLKQENPKDHLLVVPSINRRNCLGDDFNDLLILFLIYCQEHRSSFYMELIRNYDEQVST